MLWYSYLFSIFLAYSRHIYIIFKAYSSIFTEILQKILNIYILTYWGIFENIQYFPPRKPNVSEYAQNTHTNTHKSLGAKFHPFRKDTFIFIFTSYSPRIGMVLVIYCYNIQKSSNIEYFALFSRIFNINTPPVQNSKIFENSYSGILVSYSAYSPRLARPQNMQNMQWILSKYVQEYRLNIAWI